MFAYILIYVLAFLFSLCYSKSRDEYAIVVFKLLAFITLFLPIAFRYNIGTDYKSYAHFVKSAIFSDKYTVFEYGWALIIKLIDIFNIDIQFFFIIPAFFTILILFSVVPRTYFGICIPAYISIAYLESFSLVRQAFAASIFLLCAKSFIEKRKVKTLFWFVVAVLFHKSAIFMLPLLFASCFKWKCLNRYSLVFIFLLLCTFFSMFNIASFLMKNILGNSIYAGYVGSMYDKKTEMGTGLGLVLRLIMFCAILFCCSRSAINNESPMLVSRQYVLSCFAVIMLGLSHILAAQIHIFNRIPNLFSPFYVFFLLVLVQSKSKFRKLGLIIVLLILFVLFIKTLQVSSSSLGHGLGIVPYQSVFSR